MALDQMSDDGKWTRTASLLLPTHTYYDDDTGVHWLVVKRLRIARDVGVGVGGWITGRMYYRVASP